VDTQRLLPMVEALPTWDPSMAEEYFLSEADRLCRWCEEAFAHCWRRRSGLEAVRFLDQILRIASPRSSEFVAAAGLRLRIALLDHDLDAALRSGVCAMGGTGFRTLADYLSAEHLLPEGGDIFSVQMRERSAALTAGTLPEPASDAAVQLIVERLLAELLSHTDRNPTRSVSSTLSSEDGQSFYFCVEPGRVLVSTSPPRASNPFSVLLGQTLREKGFSPNAEDPDSDRRSWTRPNDRTSDVVVIKSVIRTVLDVMNEICPERVELSDWGPGFMTM
jgi:hypothetical protein